MVTCVWMTDLNFTKICAFAQVWILFLILTPSFDFFMTAGLKVSANFVSQFLWLKMDRFHRQVESHPVGWHEAVWHILEFQRRGRPHMHLVVWS